MWIVWRCLRIAAHACQSPPSAKEGKLVINGHAITMFAQKDPAQIPWGSVGADNIVESTGLFTDSAKVSASCVFPSFASLNGLP